ncbi:MAG: small ribosomal subunit Rsm22 family protein [Oscillospiraceae bacterium]|nr:small ribosomal subunit Rsm22 family protein [Oscillospiraceae bacterium]
MELPFEIRNRIQEMCAGVDAKTLSKSAERLSENYRAESSHGKRSASAKSDIAAYCAVRMPATFAAVSRALELALECFDGKINSVLDVGAGTGAGAIAARILTDYTEITLIERERNMIDAGRLFLECMGINGNWIERDITSGIHERADLVICSYCLNELPESRRKYVVERLAESAEKLLVIVEPGTPNAFASMLKTRSELIAGGMRITAPCPDVWECPLPNSDWCHFSARVARSKLHKQLKNADVPYEDEKFCFLAVTREGANPCGFRILRRPIIQPGRITMKLCGGNGVLTETVIKSNPKFKTARKADVGDAY